MRILLDTSAYSLHAGDHREAVDLVLSAEEILMSVIVLGELLTGFHRGSRFTQNQSALEDFLASPRVTIVEVGTTTAEHYGQILAAMLTKGRPIPTKDVWIADHAMETGAELISADRHFEEVDRIAWTRVALG